MHKLFSYGTLQQEDVQLATFGHKLTGVSDTLIGYKLGSLRITDPDVLAKSGKAYHPILIRTDDNNDSVEGMIFTVSDDELALADSYEVDDYKRVYAQFKSGTSAWIYADAKQEDLQEDLRDHLENQENSTLTETRSNKMQGSNNDTTPTDVSAPYLDAFTKVVESRRSVRKFTDTPIPNDVLQDCLRLAMLAPNSSNLQPWEFYIIDTPSKRKKANAICMNQNAAKTANKLIAVVARTDTWLAHAKQNLREFPATPVPEKVKNYYKKIVPLDFIRGPASVLSVAKWGATQAARHFKGPIKSPYYTSNDIKNWATNNTALAAENLMLALRAHGFDSCPMGGFDEPALKKLLNLSDDHHVVMMIGAGERSPKGIYSEQYRFDYNQFVKHV